MLKIITALGMILLGHLANGKQHRDLSPFSRIEIADVGELVYTEGIIQSVEVRGENESEMVKKVKNGTLKIQKLRNSGIKNFTLN